MARILLVVAIGLGSLFAYRVWLPHSPGAKDKTAAAVVAQLCTDSELRTRADSLGRQLENGGTMGDALGKMTELQSHVETTSLRRHIDTLAAVASYDDLTDFKAWSLDVRVRAESECAEYAARSRGQAELIALAFGDPR